MQALVCMKVAGLPVDGIIHIGANDGQERYEYAESGASICIYVEPIDEVFLNLQNHIKPLAGHIAVKAVCSDRVGDEVIFNIASNAGLSSSMLGLGAHADFHPSINYIASKKMITTTVDKVIQDLHLLDVPNLLVIDTQGAELKVLKGALKSLEYIDGIFVEVSESPLYEGGCTHSEISDFLIGLGFRLRWMHMNAVGHGDSFYCKPIISPHDLPNYQGNIALNKKASQSSVCSYSKEEDACGAINGRKTGGYGFHTDAQNNPWWKVDLLDKHPLNEIRIFNRLDAARERSRTLQIYLSLDDYNWELVHDQAGRKFGGIDGRPLRVILNKRYARYVRIQLNGFSYLHLDQIEVY